MKKLFLIFIILKFNLICSYTVNFHNQSDKKLIFYVSSTLTGCGFSTYVDANKDAKHEASFLCSGACYDEIEAWTENPSVKVAEEKNLVGGLGICAGMDIYISQNPNGKWTMSRSNLGYSHTIKNNSPYVINIYVNQASCSDDCWNAIQPGQTFLFNTSLCCIQSVTWWGNDNDGNFKGGSSGRFDLVCHNTSWSLDLSKLDDQDVYELKRLS